MRAVLLSQRVVPTIDLGYHAKNVSEFANALHKALTLSPEEQLAMRRRGRESAVRRFSEREFEAGWEASGWKDWL